MKTASELRSLMPKTVTQKISQLVDACEVAAKEGKSELLTGWEYKPDQDLWVHGGYSRTEDWETAKVTLESLGYTVTFVYKESQFVDMYTKIRWGTQDVTAN